jgi:hypothetical protein
MATDLEGAIRDALHADDISAEQLIHPTLREPDSRRPARMLAAAAAVVAVVGVAIVAAILVSGHRGDDRQAGTDPLAAALGYRWRVIQVADSHGSSPVSAPLDAQIGFTRDGYVLGDDTVNALQGEYRATSGGYAVRNSAETLVGSTRNDPLRNRLIAAVDAMFFSVVANPDETPPAVVIDMAVDGDRLTLHRGDTTLTLERVGPQPDFFAQPASATPTRTS